MEKKTVVNCCTQMIRAGHITDVQCVLCMFYKNNVFFFNNSNIKHDACGLSFSVSNNIIYVWRIIPIAYEKNVGYHRLPSWCVRRLGSGIT